MRLRLIFLLLLPLYSSCSPEVREPRYVMKEEPARPRINPASYNPNTAYRAGGFGSSPIPGTSNFIPQPRPRPTPAALPTPAPVDSGSSLSRDDQGNLSTIKPNTYGGYTVRDADGDIFTVTPRPGGGYTIREKGGQTRIVSKLPARYSALDQ